MPTAEISSPKLTLRRAASLPRFKPFLHPVVTIEDGAIAGHGACKKCDCGGFVKNDPPNGRCAWCNHSFHAHEGFWHSSAGGRAGPSCSAGTR